MCVCVCVCACEFASQQARAMLKICWMIYKVSSGSGEIPFMTKDSEGSEQGQPSLMTKLVPTRSHTHTHTHTCTGTCAI